MSDKADELRRELRRLDDEIGRLGQERRELFSKPGMPADNYRLMQSGRRVAKLELRRDEVQAKLEELTGKPR